MLYILNHRQYEFQYRALNKWTTPGSDTISDRQLDHFICILYASFYYKVLQADLFDYLNLIFLYMPYWKAFLHTTFGIQAMRYRNVNNRRSSVTMRKNRESNSLIFHFKTLTGAEVNSTHGPAPWTS